MNHDDEIDHDEHRAVSEAMREADYSHENPPPGRSTILVRLEIAGEPADALQCVEALLENGGFQDPINDAHDDNGDEYGPLLVLSATAGLAADLRRAGMVPGDVPALVERARVVGVLDAWRSGSQDGSRREMSERTGGSLGSVCELRLYPGTVLERLFVGQDADAARAAAAKAIEAGEAG